MKRKSPPVPARRAGPARPFSPARLRWEDLEAALEGRSRSGRVTDAHLQQLFGDPLLGELRLLAAQSSRRAARADAPRVYLLPGIMGSTLGERNKTLWLDDVLWLDPLDIALNQFDRLALTPRGIPSDPRVGALDLFPVVYLRMAMSLKRAGYDVVRFPFDWRLDITTLGRRLADALRAEPRPVTIVAHSMGGLVARAALKQLDAGRARPVSKLIMLGTPNHGSFAPVKALTGHHDITRQLTWIDFNDDELDWADRIYKTFDGLVQMLPDPAAYRDVDLYAPTGWPAGLASVPAPAMLERAANSWARAFAPGDDRMVVIAGVGRDTTVGMSVNGPDITFTSSSQGDGTVPLRFAQLAGIGAGYGVEGDHMWLPFNRDVIDGVHALLRDQTPGTLTPLDQMRARAGGERVWDEPAPAPRAARGPAPRATTKPFPLPPPLLLPSAAEASPAGEPDGPVETLETIEVSRTRQVPVEITLARGDIRALNCRAIAVGIFENVRPAGAAAALDRALDGAIGRLIDRRMFDAGLGEVFVLPASRRRIPAEYIVFVGLGDFDRFNGGAQRTAAASLSRTLLQLNIEDAGLVLFGGGSGFDARSSLAETIRGFLDAVSEPSSGRLRAITVCELDPLRYRDICVEMRALLHTDLFDDIQVFLRTTELPAPLELASAGTRAPAAAPDACYLMLRAEGRPGERDFVLQASVLPPSARAAIQSERQPLPPARWKAIRALLPESTAPTKLEALGRLVGEALHPSIREVLVAHASSPLVLIHDAAASVLPWETMSLPGPKGRWIQPGLEGGLHRHFATEGLAAARWRKRAEAGAGLRVLLIANPTDDLPGAGHEADEVVKKLRAEVPGVEITELRGARARRLAVLAELRKGAHDVLHYAGHAFFDAENRGRSGLICAGGEVLTGRDIQTLSTLPALVVLNACESARIRGKRGAPRFAVENARVLKPVELTSLAEAFLRAGVANYIGTYWPVGDTAAADFARAVYSGLTTGQTLGTSVLTARRTLSTAHDPDWADYLLFGPPGFRL